MKKLTLKLASAGLALALVSVACGNDDEESTTPGQGSSATTAPAAAAVSATTGAATLRAGLTGLLTEHVYLAALATDSALRGDTKGFDAYATALNGPTNSNTADLTAAITSVYGAEVGEAFDGLWRSEGHIPGFVAYTEGVAANDRAKADKAVADLLAYAKTVGLTLNSVNSNLPAAAIEQGVKTHVSTLKTVIDAQKVGDQAKVYSSLRLAYSHMGGFAATLAGATQAKFPDKIDGMADSKAATLRAGMTSLLREHVLLVSSATGAALGGRQPQFGAATAALNGPTNSNTADLVTAITSVYGADAGKTFDGLWRSEGHIPAFVAYTQAIATDDRAKADKAVADALGYARTFGTAMNSVNSNLSAAAVEDAIKMHVTTLKDVIDAQKAGDPTKTAAALRTAVNHMSETATVLADATVKKFVEKF